jgi:hypothetical protein
VQVGGAPLDVALHTQHISLGTLRLLHCLLTSALRGLLSGHLLGHYRHIHLGQQLGFLGVPWAEVRAQTFRLTPQFFRGTLGARLRSRVQEAEKRHLLHGPEAAGDARESDDEG